MHVLRLRALRRAAGSRAWPWRRLGVSRVSWVSWGELGDQSVEEILSTPNNNGIRLRDDRRRLQARLARGQSVAVGGRAGSRAGPGLGVTVSWAGGSGCGGGGLGGLSLLLPLLPSKQSGLGSSGSVALVMKISAMTAGDSKSAWRGQWAGWAGGELGWSR